MKKVFTSIPSVAARGPLPTVIKSWNSSAFFLLFLFCCFSLGFFASPEAKEQNLAAPRELFKGRGEPTASRNVYKAEGSRQVMGELETIETISDEKSRVKNVDHGPLQPLDDYINAKKRLSIERPISFAYGEEETTSKGRPYQYSGHKGDNIRKSGDYNRHFNERFKNERHQKFQTGDWPHGSEKILLGSQGDKANKDDKETKHGSSLTESKSRKHNQKVSPSGMALSGNEILDRHGRPRTKQRKINRERERLGQRNKKENNLLPKGKLSKLSSHGGISGKDLTTKIIHPKNIPSIGNFSKESFEGQTTTEHNIDHFRHTTTYDVQKEGAVPEGDTPSRPSRVPIPSVVPSKSSQWHTSQTPSLPHVQSRHAHRDDLQGSWKGKRGPKGATSLSKDRGGVWSLNLRENRGRRHLDGKEEDGKRKIEDGEEEEEENTDNKNEQKGHSHEGLTVNDNDSRNIGRQQQQPPEWENWGNHHDANEAEVGHLPTGGNFGGWHSDSEDRGAYPEVLEHDEEDRAAWEESNGPFHWDGTNQVVRIDDIAHQHNNAIHGILSESGCGCWDTDAVHPEVECSCGGPDLKQIPANLSQEVFRITVMDAGLDTLRNDSFTRYQNTLQDIVLQHVMEFHTIEAGAFRGLTQLRSIYIHSAPMLKTMPNLTFTEDNTKLRSLRIVSSGLERVPVMQFNGPKEIFHMIELDSNRIQTIHSRSLRVRVEELSLNYNLIENVEKEAFSGSDIGKLSLKGNRKLTYLHPEAFEGINSLRTLDLSMTSITSLPTSGLKELEVLLLENTPTLKVFPSVYSFKTIKEAYLTYPYHCCAFQFPEQHDREQYISHKKVIELEQENCSEVTSPSSPSMAPTTRVRRRRHASLPPVEGFQYAQTFSASAKTEESLTETEEEEWGNARSEMSSETDIMLSSATSSHNKQMQRRHGRNSDDTNQSFDNVDSSPLTSKESPELVKTKSSLKRNARNIKGLFNSDANTQSKTRHYIHRERHSRPKINSTVSDESDSQSIFPESRNIDHSASPRLQLKPEYERKRMSQPKESKIPRVKQPLPKGNHNDYGIYDIEDFIPVPDKRFETVPDDSTGPLPAETFEQMPEKRFGLEEMPHNPDEGFVGGIGGAGGGFPSYILGFGSFNHTSDRYPADPSKFNDTSHIGSWGGGQNVPLGTGLAIEHGDSISPLGFPDNNGILPGSDGFDKTGGFHVDEESADGHVIDTNKQGSDQQNPKSWHPPMHSLNNTTIVVLCGNLSKNYHDVKCQPEPDAFNPCEDIMGNLALRVAVWFVVVTAVVGNLAVMLVLVSSKFRMTVSKFLMVNLALADLCMGIYLLIIASMDLHTIGVYFNHAIDWQNGPGCKVAGFLTVFASELSIFTLTVITSERWYAITYAIHLNKRLKLSMAAKIMVIGWLYSITMATLPLVGISGYSKTSICLPMETGNPLALAYLISLLLVNGLAFFVITACYASMYCSISRHDASASHSDLTVAKRMALLVFTDFACWAPIAFFGLTAVAGIPLINVTRAKILLVFFYPLNSCANPYLYAILTKQYRRDLFILLARYGFCTKRAMRYKGAYSSVNNTFPHNTVVNAPNHRNSTLTQITLCDLTRTARTSQQSNNGSLLGTMIGGSQDSLQRSISPSRTPTKPETCCGDTERLSTVQETSHSNHSDDDNNSETGHQREESSQSAPSVVVKQAGSPHPIKNCYTRLSFTAEQEQILKQALSESKAKKKMRSEAEKENGMQAIEENEKRITENAKDQGEAIVMCEVKVDSEEQERCVVNNKNSNEIEEATSAV